jgi:hypothetical protein
MMGTNPTVTAEKASPEFCPPLVPAEFCQKFLKWLVQISHNPE